MRSARRPSTSTSTSACGSGTPLEPYDPGVVINRANRLYSTAAMSSGCTQPVIAENELNGANRSRPGRANERAYRRNVLIYMQTLSALGARPVILVPSAPYMGGEAGDWWRQVSQYADIVRESYFAAPGDRQARADRGQPDAAATCSASVWPSSPPSALPASKLGLMLGFQTTPRLGRPRRRSAQLAGSR